MAVLEGGVSAALAGIAEESGSPLHVVSKPDPVGVLGHYRTSHRAVLVATQAANSRLFELQNAHATNLIVIHDIRVEWTQTAAHTAAIMDSLDIYRCTSFSAVDTTNTVTPAISKLRTSFATAGANVRGITVAGIAAGMTGGTLTKDTAPLRQFGLWMTAAVPTAGPTSRLDGSYTPKVADGESPLILVQNEGLIIENRVLLGAAAGSAVSIDIEWSELTAY
ncbi:MAG: hypothetical protein JNM56_10200 [Planctomycetia bacterium]|nr:hypothetical protein [Planctomycetia bacterium]